MRGLYRFWARLSVLQKFIVGSVAATIIGTPVTSAMSWLGDKVPLLAFLTVGANILADFASDRLVIGVFVGAVLFGLGPLVWAGVKSLTPKGWSTLSTFAMALLVLATCGYTIGGDIYKS